MLETWVSKETKALMAPRARKAMLVLKGLLVPMAPPAPPARAGLKVP